MWGFVTRFVFDILYVTGLMFNRVAKGDSIEAGSNMFAIAVIFILVELSVYINMKAKALLFLKVKMSE